MVGLDAAGKTTILYKLKLGEIVTTIPTIGKFSLSTFSRSLVESVGHHARLSGRVERVEEEGAREVMTSRRSKE